MVFCEVPEVPQSIRARVWTVMSNHKRNGTHSYEALSNQIVFIKLSARDRKRGDLEGS